MSVNLEYDVFLSHSAKDKAVVRPVAERLRADGLNVWFDEWVLKAGNSITVKIEEGLEHSRVLVLCHAGPSLRVFRVFRGGLQRMRQAESMSAPLAVEGSDSR